MVRLPPGLVAVLAASLALGAAGCPLRSDAVAPTDGGPMTDAAPVTDAGPMLCQFEKAPPGTVVMTLDTAGPGGALALGDPCDPADNQCTPGTLCCAPCCIPGDQPVCMDADVTGACPLPDVFLDEPYLAGSITFDWQSFSPAGCEMFEGCIEAPGLRRLLHFGIQLPNTGTSDLHIGVPDPANANFEFSACHGHYHFVDYGRYRLLTLDGCEAAVGHKNGFCVLDLSPYSPGAGPAQYGCGDMGITVGWSDIYGVGTGCQWVDITDVPPGDYLLEAAVNFDFRIPESNFENNFVRIPVTIPPDGPPPPGDPLAACTDVETDEGRDCSWVLDGDYPCTAGAPVTVGCNADCAPPTGACTGDAMIRICVGPSNVCTAATAIGGNDDACGTFCPQAMADCPATGVITVLTAPWSSDQMYTCTLSVQ